MFCRFVWALWYSQRLCYLPCGTSMRLVRASRKKYFPNNIKSRFSGFTSLDFIANLTGEQASLLKMDCLILSFEFGDCRLITELKSLAFFSIDDFSQVAFAAASFSYFVLTNYSVNLALIFFIFLALFLVSLSKVFTILALLFSILCLAPFYEIRGFSH